MQWGFASSIRISENEERLSLGKKRVIRQKASTTNKLFEVNVINYL
jgi:hypothetical protein